MKEINDIVGYARVSTQRQGKDGVSIEAQKQNIIDYAKMIELIEPDETIKIYVDKGYSGGSLVRPAISELIQRIKMREIKVLICYDLSRITRDVLDGTKFMNICKKYGVILKCLRDQVQLDTADDRLLANIKMAVNQNERERVVEKTNDAILYIIKSGRYPFGGLIPYGWYKGNDKFLYIDTEQEVHVKKVFEMALKDRSTLTEMRDYMNYNDNTRKWTTYMIYKMLHDKKYSGVITFKGVDYEGCIPKIIDNEVQMKAISLYKKYKKKDDENYIYDQLVYCDCHLTKMTCASAYGHGGKYYYYKCNDCGCSIPQNVIEESMQDIKLEYEDVGIRIKNITDEIDLYNKKAKRLKEKYILSKIDEQTYASMVFPLEERINELSVICRGLQLRKKETIYKDITSLYDKKAFVMMNVRMIYVNPKNKTVSRVVLVGDD